MSIEIGKDYEFHSEIQEAEEPADRRLRNYTGQKVTVIGGPEHDESGEEGSDLFTVRAADGREFQAWTEELDGWDKELGQFFWPDGTYGPNHDTQFLRNERSPA